MLLCRKAWKTFPLFVSYFTVGLASSVFIYAFRQHKAFYFYSYWLMEALGVALGFAVVYEVFSNLFSAHIALRRLATVVFKCVLALLLCIGLIVLIKHSPLDARGVASAVVVVEEVARIIEVGMLMCLFVLSSAFGLHWRQQIFGIAVGLGIFIAVELIAVTVWGMTGKAAHDALNVVRVLGFNTSLLIWIGYLLAPERAASPVELPEQSQLEQWNQAVMELIRQ
ncbi:MAG TPA: hypothetical protein VFY05_01515 [Candidatus Angelobacter sp.]|nr:hypothetical protein [Candidatus Angelobacter sp.]